MNERREPLCLSCWTRYPKWKKQRLTSQSTVAIPEDKGRDESLRTGDVDNGGREKRERGGERTIRGNTDFKLLAIYRDLDDELSTK